MKWSDCKITIYDKDHKPIEIEAKCKGLFAMHKSLDDENLLALSLIPLGANILNETTKGRIYKAVKELEQLDWSQVKEYNQKPPESFEYNKFRSIQNLYSYPDV